MKIPYISKLGPKDLEKLTGQDIILKLPSSSELLPVKVFLDSSQEYEFLVKNRSYPPIKSVKTNGKLKYISDNFFALTGDYSIFHYFGDVDKQGYEKRKKFLEEESLNPKLKNPNTFFKVW